METSHVVIAIGGLLVGYSFQGSPAPTVVDRPCSCHCACSTPVAEGARWELYLAFAGLLILVLLGLGYFSWTALRGLKEPEFSFSFKGKAGKGVYQARRGLQILDG